MAKISFTSITPIKSIEDKIVKFEDKDVVVKQYLPIKDKADLVTYVIQSAFDENGLFSPVRQEIYVTIGLLRWYTNINFTDNMMINVEKTYDSIVLNHVNNLLDEINEDEYNCIIDMIDDAVIETKDYLRSFAGQLRSARQDYDETNFDMEKIAETLQDPKQIGLVKEIMEKMG